MAARCGGSGDGRREGCVDVRAVRRLGAARRGERACVLGVSG